MTNRPHPFAYLRTLLEADLRVLLKNKRAVIISLLLPLYILLITSKQGHGQTKLGSTPFLVFLALTIGMLSTALMGYAMIVARDRERGVFQRLRVTPAPTWAIMVSRLAVQILACLVIAIFVLIIGGRIEHLSFGVEAYVATLLVTILAGAVFLSIAQALVGLIKSATTINAVAGLIYVALLMSGLLGPSGELGTTIQNISKWTPVDVVINVFQGATRQMSWTSDTWLSLLACFGYIAIFAAIGIRWFQWEAR